MLVSFDISKMIVQILKSYSGIGIDNQHHIIYECVGKIVQPQVMANLMGQE